MEANFKIYDYTPTYDEVKEFVGGYIERVLLPNNDVLLVDEDGRMKQLEYNADASMYWYERRKENGEDWIDPNCIIVGNAVCVPAEHRNDEW